MQQAAAVDDDILHASTVTWMDFYVLYSFIIGIVAFVTATIDKNALTATWGIWTSCAIAYFARDRQTWSPKCDVAVIMFAVPVATASSKRHAIQFVAFLQIAIHFGLLVARKYQLHKTSEAAENAPVFYSEDEEEAEVCI